MNAVDVKGYKTGEMAEDRNQMTPVYDFYYCMHEQMDDNIFAINLFVWSFLFGEISERLSHDDPTLSQFIEFIDIWFLISFRSK